MHHYNEELFSEYLNEYSHKYLALTADILLTAKTNPKIHIMLNVCKAVQRAHLLALQADVICALTLEALKGTKRAFDAQLHSIRPHQGQMAVATRLRALLHSDIFPSTLYGMCLLPDVLCNYPIYTTLNLSHLAL